MADSQVRIDGIPPNKSSGDSGTPTYMKLIDNGDGTYSIATSAAGVSSIKTATSTKADRSLTATTSNQVAAAANANRNRLILKNADQAISVFVNIGAAATVGAGSIEIGAKGYLELTGTNQSVNIIAASGTPVVTIWEF